MLEKLFKSGVSVWLDSLSRDMLHSGYLAKWIEAGVRGQTSNPTIFQGSIQKSQTYNEDIRSLSKAGMSAEQICWELMVADVQAACDRFLPLYQSSKGGDGFVSLELDPLKARDTQGSLAQGLALWPKVNRPNLMIKVPATKEGIPVLKGLVEAGFNVNVTLLFAVERYDEVMLAHMEALEARLAAGHSIAGIATVASFFVSRVDTEVEKRLAGKSLSDEQKSGLLGKVAVANARAAYAQFEKRLAEPRWQALAAQGAQIMRPLWASTGVKNKAYSDTLYVDELVGPHCVNTMPESTLEAVVDHGRSEFTLSSAHLEDAQRVLQLLAEVGVDLADVTLNTLEVEGVDKFADSYRDLLAALERSVQTLSV
jgi:transaldolase